VRTLVTNDDGIDSDGLVVLALAAVAAGLDVVVAAPLEEASGTGAGLAATEGSGGVLVERRALPDLDGVDAYAVAAHPGFIALAATDGAFGAVPEVVLSGVNLGANLGRAILHSGTVGAALTGALHDARAMAVSLAVGLDPQRPPQWDSATAVLSVVLPLLLDTPPGSVLNVNVPDLPRDRLGSLRATRLARFGTVQSRIEQQGESGLRRVPTEVEGDVEPGTDAAALAEGYVTISAVQPVTDATEPMLPERLPGLP
jgi:5'-nucleotidase